VTACHSQAVVAVSLGAAALRDGLAQHFAHGNLKVWGSPEEWMEIHQGRLVPICDVLNH